jgi:hypothetical protein
VQAKVEPVIAELTTENAADLLAGSALVVDAFDNRAARAAVSAAARASGLPCVHVGFSPDGLYGSAIWEPGYRVPHDAAGDPYDYPLTRPLVLVLAALAARTVVAYLADGRRQDFEVTWRDLGVSAYTAP